MNSEDIFPEIPTILTIIIGLSLTIYGGYLAVNSTLNNSNSFMGFLLIMIGMFGFIFFGGLLSIQLRFIISDSIYRKDLKKQLGVKS